MGKRAGLLLASLGLGGTLAACVSPGPLAVTGTLPPPATSFALLGDDAEAQAARQPLIDALTRQGLRYTLDKPERFVSVTLADRPRRTGTVAGTTLPASRTAAGWTDRPVKGGWFAHHRREMRLAVTFFSPDGEQRETRMATGIVARSAPAPDVARLVETVLRR